MSELRHFFFFPKHCLRIRIRISFFCMSFCVTVTSLSKELNKSYSRMETERKYTQIPVMFDKKSPFSNRID